MAASQDYAEDFHETYCTLYNVQWPYFRVTMITQLRSRHCSALALDNGVEYLNDWNLEISVKRHLSTYTGAAAESPWSNGVCERHNSFSADIMSKIIEDTGCGIELAVSCVIHAKNSLANIYWFSP